MIMEIFNLRTISEGPLNTINYILGVTDRKGVESSESCHFLTSNYSFVPFSTCPDPPSQVATFARKAADEMADMAARNKRVKKPYWHAMISQSLEDAGRLSNSDWVDIVERVMTRLGFSACTYIAAIHKDTKAEHVHIVACTVQDAPNYPVVKRLKDFQIAEEIMREIEVKYDLERVVSSSDVEKTNNSDKRNSRKQELRDILDPLAKGVLATPGATLLTLFQRARAKNITIQLQWKNGLPTGISYGHAGFTIPGSKLAAQGRYSLKGLLKAGISMPTGHELSELEDKTAPIGKPKQHPSGQSAPPTREDAFCDYNISVLIPSTAADTLRKKAPTITPHRTEQPHKAWERWHFMVRIRTWGKKKITNAIGFLERITKALAAHLEQLLEALNQPGSITPEHPKVADNSDTTPITIHDGPKTSPKNQVLRVLRQPQQKKRGFDKEAVMRPTPITVAMPKASIKDGLPFDL